MQLRSGHSNLATSKLLEISNESSTHRNMEIDLVNDIGYWSKVIREIQSGLERQPDLEESLLFIKKENTEII